MSSYLVLARKYRPKTFGDLIGQSQVSHTLTRALEIGRLAHAYLFTGPRGVGKTTAARLLSMALSCSGEPPKPCGVCPCCQEIQKGLSLDVVEVDGASNRGINEIRSLRESVKYLPVKNPKKVYIIDEVHALTNEAFNALLKTLEEPPSHVVFIFATTEAHKLPATILSRCQRYDFRRIRVEDIVARLADVAEKENIPAAKDALTVIARQAEGGLRDALGLMDQVIASSGEISLEAVINSLGLINQELIIRTGLSALKGDMKDSLAALDEAYNLGYDFKELGYRALELIRTLTLFKASPSVGEVLDLTDAEIKRYKEITADLTLPTLHRHLENWLKFQNELARHSQPRWLMESHLIRLAQMAPLADLGALTQRLITFLESGTIPPAADPSPPARSQDSPIAQAPAPAPPQPARQAEAAPVTLEGKYTAPTIEQPKPAVQPEIRPTPEIQATLIPEAPKAPVSQVNLEAPVTRADEQPKESPQTPWPVSEGPVPTTLEVQPTAPTVEQPKPAVQPEIRPTPEIQAAPIPEVTKAADSQVNLEDAVIRADERLKELPKPQQPESPASIEPAPLWPQPARQVEAGPVPTTVEVRPMTTTVEQPIPAVQSEIKPAPEIQATPTPEAADSQVNLEAPLITADEQPQELPKELPQPQQPEFPASIEPAPLWPQTASPVSEEPVPATLEVKDLAPTVEQPIPAVQPEIKPAPEIQATPAPEAAQAADSQVNLEDAVATAEEPPKDWSQEPAPGPMLDQVQANTQISAQADEPVFSHETSPLMAPRPVID
ncbi:MAG: DNA polymerase III subunit gamma/tau, partial [Deltaproteobacteria bacterium]|nr:DNA polymerase III subunit gamma/tau [Deltaproteobacteria bacterium]